MTLTLEQAKSLRLNDVIYLVRYRNADGSPQRCWVSGKVKLSKRSPGRVEVPLRVDMRLTHGRVCGHSCVTETNLDLFSLTEENVPAVQTKPAVKKEGGRRRSLLACLYGLLKR